MEEEKNINPHHRKEMDEFELKRGELWDKRVQFEKKLHLYEGDELKKISLFEYLKTKTITLLLKSVGLYNRGQLNASKISLRKVKFVFPDIPKGLHGLKILFIADLHLLQYYTSWFISGMSVIEQLKTPVDLILLGGDYRFGYFGPEDFVVPMIKEMLDKVEVKYGIYGVLGNHDISTVKEKFEEVGIHILVNEGVEISHNGTKIWISGVDAQHKIECADLSLAIADAPENAFKITVSHSPEFELIEEASLWGVQLYLCGHTHGGQIGFPFIGPLYTNAKCKRKFAKGKWEYQNMQGYTTTGFGVTDVPVRFFAEPEIVIIEILKIPFDIKNDYFILKKSLKMNKIND